MATVVLVLLLGTAIVGLIVAAVLQVRGLSRRRSALAAFAAAGAGLVAVVLYGFELIGYALNDSAPEYYSWSSYVEYHELPGIAAVALLAAYAALPVTLVAAAFAVGRRGHGAGVLLGAAGVVAAFLPLMVPSWLPSEVRGEDAALYTHGPAERTGPTIAACLPYGRDGGPAGQTRDAVLCLRLADTPRARKLLNEDTGGPELSRLADQLNDRGVEPRDSVENTGIDGLEVERAEWRGRR